MALDFRPLTPAFGLEALGLDLSRPVDDATFLRIEDAFNRSSLLLVRGQRLTEEHHIAFSRRFGKLQDHVLKPYLSNQHPELLVVSNILENGRPIGIMDAGHEWHSDTSYTADPCRCSLLYSREIPAREGERSYGDTVFASAAAAYDALTEEEKRQLAPLTARHSYSWYYARMQAQGSKRPDLTEQQKRETPDVDHPVVRPHPITGRKAIYVNQSFTVRINELPEAESAALLKRLLAHVIKPEFTYRHRWEKGDLIIWDNPTSQHLAIADYKLPQRRLMHRTTVLPQHAA
jgi:taurine dioxygenase